MPSAEIRDQFQLADEGLKKAIRAQSSDKRMIVDGQTDNQGSDASNQPLSMSRARAVRDDLVARGVDPDRIGAVGIGSSRPLLSNNAENRAHNRRVEVVIRSAKAILR